MGTVLSVHGKGKGWRELDCARLRDGLRKPGSGLES